MNTVVKQAEQNVVQAAKRSVLLDMAERYNMEPAAFEAVVRATCLPPDRKTGKVASREEFAAFLLVAREYNLNPLTKEIFGFVGKSGGIQPVVSVDGWSNLINSHPAFDGMEFDDHQDGNGNLTAITCRIYRKDRSHPISVTEYMAECRRATDPWQQWGRRMLRHKAFIQAARYAFGFAGVVDPDEADRMAGDLARDVSPPRARPAIGDALAEFGRVDPSAERFDSDTGEIHSEEPASLQGADPQPIPAVEEPAPPPAAPASGAGRSETWKEYQERWHRLIEAAVPRQADQLAKAWNNERPQRNRITWPDEETDRALDRRVNEALEMLRKG